MIVFFNVWSLRLKLGLQKRYKTMPTTTPQSLRWCLMTTDQPSKTRYLYNNNIKYQFKIILLCLVNHLIYKLQNYCLLKKSVEMNV